MAATPELMLALLSFLPDGVALLVVDAGEARILTVNADGDPAQAPHIAGPEPLAARMGWPTDGPELASLLARLDAGDAADLVLPRAGGSVALDLIALPHAPGPQRFFLGLERRGEASVAPAARLVVRRDDRLSGLAHRDWFWELYRRDCHIAARERRPIALLVIDVDALGAYNDTFGGPAADRMIRLVGRALSAGLRRAGDLIARDEGGRFLALVLAGGAEAVRRHAGQLAARVRDLHLHHPRYAVKVVTVSIGGVYWAGGRPADGAAPTPEHLFERALAALDLSRAAGRNRATLVGLDGGLDVGLDSGADDGPV